MRKSILFILFGLIAACAISCKSREKCPAYGQHPQKAVERPA